MGIDIDIEDDRWRALDLEALATRAAAAALDLLGHDLVGSDISVLACADARIAELNAEFRGKPVPTNVLSWPTQDLAAELAGGDPDQPAPDFTGEMALGDIAIAWETCAREAREAGKTMQDHVSHLIVHGVLHLLGYDHIRDPDATLMEGLETRILGRLGIDDPYREQVGP